MAGVATVNLGEVRRIDVRVYLRGAYVGMAEELLDDPHIRPVREHVRGIRMAKYMRRYPVRRNPGGGGSLTHDLEDALPRKRASQTSDEHMRLGKVALRQRAAPGRKVRGKRPSRAAAYRYNALLRAFPEHAHQLSVGDYVLTGGELPALVLTDAVARMCEDVLPSAEAYEEESHYNGLLEYPQYTRPEIWEDIAVPPVLLSGHHKNIAQWRAEKSMEITKERRPDLWSKWSKKAD
jgi:hypothetical protein